MEWMEEMSKRWEVTSVDSSLYLRQVSIKYHFSVFYPLTDTAVDEAYKDARFFGRLVEKCSRSI